jgi:PAS domain S-box-containing protein
MQAALPMAESTQRKSQLSQLAHLAILGGLGLVAILQAQQLSKTPQKQTPASSVIPRAMQAQFNAISSAIASYMENHDPQSLGQERSGLPYARVEQAHEEVRVATLNLLAADQDVVKTRQAANELSETLMSLLTQRMESTIRSNQLNSSARLKAVQSAISEAKGLTNVQVPGNDADLSQTRFRKATITYEELSRTRRATRWAEEANRLFDQGMDRSRDLRQAEEQKQTEMTLYKQKHNAIDVILTEYSSAGTPRLPGTLLQQALSSGVANMGLIWGFLLAGVILVMTASRPAEKQLLTPLRDILQCVEAAATGDVSRIPIHRSRDEVGRLAQAVGRLITVLARSENLVYHLATLVESSGEAIISHTLDGTILSWNKGAQRIYGYSAEEMKGRSISVLSADAGDSELMNHLQRIQRGERIQPFETIHQARNGRQVRALVRVSAILDSTRKVIGASFCAQDLTGTQLLRPKTIEGSEIY